ncbi:hypothetical protein KEJ39_00335 [Candidatus Bathyarchaeota archaeon]|nr:hypothetical protein [Candidatus Bathyarchaeota archaeon]
MLIGLQELLLITIVMIMLVLPEFSRGHKKSFGYRVKLYTIVALLLVSLAIMSRFILRLFSIIVILLLLLAVTALMLLKSLTKR